MAILKAIVAIHVEIHVYETNDCSWGETVLDIGHGFVEVLDAAGDQATVYEVELFIWRSEMF
jgi:hypothetical protein